MILKAYAKVNLCLDVLRRREDGYHDVKMVMQNIGLYDELSFVYECAAKASTSDEGSDAYVIELTSDSDNNQVPMDETNLIYKAIKLMFEAYDIHGSMKIKLKKSIPVAAGMAGGSTDCAAAIKAVNTLCGLNLSLQDMMDIGVKLGADVPFCLMAKTALSEGIGEVLTGISPLSDCHILVAKPPVSVSTGMVYNNLRLDQIEPDEHPDVDGMVKALEDGDLRRVAAKMDNILESVTVKLNPEIKTIKDIMISMGALNALMSGSGPTVFGLYEDMEEAMAAKAYIIKKGLANEVYITNPV